LHLILVEGCVELLISVFTTGINSPHEGQVVWEKSAWPKSRKYCPIARLGAIVLFKRTTDELFHIVESSSCKQVLLEEKRSRCTGSLLPSSVSAALVDDVWVSKALLSIKCADKKHDWETEERNQNRDPFSVAAVTHSALDILRYSAYRSHQP
jgi:hypothetical protein